MLHPQQLFPLFLPHLEEWNQKTWSANRSKMVLASQPVKQNCNQSSLKRNEGISHAKVVRRKKSNIYIYVRIIVYIYINIKWWIIRFRSNIFSPFPLCCVSFHFSSKNNDAKLSRTCWLISTDPKGPDKLTRVVTPWCWFLNEKTPK